MTAGRPAIAAWLREILRCPGCRAELEDIDAPDGPLLRCLGCGLGYRVEDGIPVLLLDEAVPPDRPTTAGEDGHGA